MTMRGGGRRLRDCVGHAGGLGLQLGLRRKGRGAGAWQGSGRLDTCDSMLVVVLNRGEPAAWCGA